MKKFMFLHFGFETPTPEIMEAWGKWFESIAHKQVDQGGFGGGREISKPDKELPWGMGPSPLQYHQAETSTRQRRSRTIIHTSQASGSMIRCIEAEAIFWRGGCCPVNNYGKPEGSGSAIAAGVRLSGGFGEALASGSGRS
jgi:hypothetical protein